MRTRKKTLSSVFASLVACAAMCCHATELKIVNMAINESYNSKDGAAFLTYLETDVVDFGAFELGKANTYFLAAGTYTKGGVNYTVAVNSVGANDHQFFLYNSDKYSLVSFTGASGYPTAAVQDKLTGVQYGIMSCRGTYKDDKVSATLGPVKTKIENFSSAYPDALFFVSYNARLTGTYSTTGNAYADILDTYLTTTSSGPQMTGLGRGTVGGFYVAPEQVPDEYAVADLAIEGAKYTGTVVRVTVPTKHRVIFNDYNDIGLQTNVVLHGESVTPPTPPERSGFTFVGWDHDASEFESVTNSFITTAQYVVLGDSHLVTYLNWNGEWLHEESVEDGDTCNPPDAPVRPDYEFANWTTNGVPFDIVTPITEDLTLKASYALVPVQETATTADFLRRIQAAYPTGTVIRLTADIDLGKASIATTNFYGVLDGNGHKLTGIANEGRLFKNLYGTVRNCTFADLGDGVWETRSARSALARNAYGALVENCVFTNCQMCGNIASGGAGLVALETFANGEVNTVITNCTAINCRVVSKGTYSATVFGGFVKSAKGTDFFNCRFLVDDRESKSIGGTGYANGGIAGESLGGCRFFGCYNEGKVVSSVAGDNYKGAGGICGGANGLTECYNCTNIADIVGCKDEGSAGIVARGCKCTVIISGCVNRGNVTTQYGGSATNPYGRGAGGLIAGNWGNASTIKIIDSANYGNISTTTNDCDAGGLVGSFDTQGSILYITNAFNYGNVISEQYAGGIVGQLYKHWISVNNVGNSGNVTSTTKRAGGFAGHIGNGANHSSYDLRGFMNCGEIVGSRSAALVAGGYEETGSGYVDCHIRVYDSVLAGSVSSATGTVGVLSGALVGSYASTMQGYADENTILLQKGLYDYYNSEGPQSLATPIAAMTAADLTNRRAQRVLNANAEYYGCAPWIKGEKFPELSLFAVERTGFMIIVR